jgi:hypothetical protein
MAEKIQDQTPADEGSKNLQSAETTADLGRGSVPMGASYGNGQRRTCKVGTISDQQNVVGEDRIQMPGLNRN